MLRLATAVGAALLLASCTQGGSAYDYAASARASNQATMRANAAEVDRFMAGKVPADYRAVIDAYLATALKDPDSRRVVYGATPSGGIACGTVNAKNSYGGYTGAEPFTARFDAAGKLYQLDIYGPAEVRAAREANTVVQIMYPYQRLLSACGFI